MDLMVVISRSTLYEIGRALDMKLILCDERAEILEAWKTQFLTRPEVQIRREDILKVPSDAFLLPGNSFGFLDGGLELRIHELYGWEIQDQLRTLLRAEHEGELLVGQGVLLRHSSLPRAMVYAPIWRTPRRISNTVNVFLALRGAFLALKKDKGSPRIETLAVPAMGVGAGDLDPAISARQMRYAYEITAGLRGPGDKNLSQLARREKKLLSIPGSEKAEADE